MCLLVIGFILVVIGMDDVIFIQKNGIYYKIIGNITIDQYKTETFWDQVCTVLQHCFIDCVNSRGTNDVSNAIPI